MNEQHRRRSRKGRTLKPELLACEPRALLSVYTDLMGANSLAAGRRSAAALVSRSLSPAMTGGSTQSIATPNNQGPVLNANGTINNQALAPTGTLTGRQLKIEQFRARYVGTFTVGAGRTSTEARRVFIAAAGTANTMLHSDIQALFVVPKDPTLAIGGVSAIFDRNLNSNTVLGFDLSAPVQNVDHAGRPNLFPKVSIDVNASAGVYDEAYSVGTMKIHYIPNGKHTRGVLSQGKAIITIHAQIYAPNVAFILRNATIDP